MRNFLQTRESSDKTLQELSHLIYRIEAHLYRGELGTASSLLAALEEKMGRLREDTKFPLATVAIGAQIGFLSGGANRGRIPGAIVGGILGWLYGQHSASHMLLELEILDTRIKDLHHLLTTQARRLAEKN